LYGTFKNNSLQSALTDKAKTGSSEQKTIYQKGQTKARQDHDQVKIKLEQEDNKRQYKKT